MTSIAMPSDPMDWPEWFKKNRAMFLPRSFAMENDYSAWGRKFQKYLDSIDGLSKDEQKKLIIEWEKNNPPPIPKYQDKNKKRTQEDLLEFDFKVPNTFYKE